MPASVEHLVACALLELVRRGKGTENVDAGGAPSELSLLLRCYEVSVRELGRAASLLDRFDDLGSGDARSRPLTRTLQWR